MVEKLKTKMQLKVDDALWKKFVDTVPRSKKLNEAVVELLENAVKK